MNRTVNEHDNMFLEADKHNLTIKETDQIYDTENGMVRLYRTSVGNDDDYYSLQIRAFQPLKEGLKPRNIVATVNLSLEDLKWLVNQAQQITNLNYSRRKETA